MTLDISLLTWLATTVAAMILLYCLSALRTWWLHRRVVAELASALILVGLSFLFLTPFAFISQLILATIQLWLAVLCVRLIFGRLEERFLRASTQHNTLLAFLLLSLVISMWAVFSLVQQRTALDILLFVLLGISLVTASIFLYQVIWTLKHYRLRKLNKHLTLRDMPTVTLAIPARNETRALTECLSAAVASDYPKLEILVLDDCSQDKTSDLIRAFAHDGVRFIQGDQPAEGWLGKNQACQVLAEHASGEYLIFIGVDTQLAPQSISQLVNYAVSNNVAMVTALPQNREGLHISTVLAQLRYFWQIVLPITRRRVAVATQCWLIKADALQHLGGLAAVKHKIVPEGSFARRLFSTDNYRFIVSSADLGITTAKRWTSQNESAIRFLYPTFKRQPLYVLAGFLFIALAVAGPFVAALVLPVQEGLSVVWWLALLVCIVYLASYQLVVIRTYPRTWVLTLLFFPISLIQELVLLVVSMLLYEFDGVNWKGRNVCYPVIAVPPGRLFDSSKK